jgi:putative ATPase
MADSRALQIAVAAYQACQFLGMPECNVHLTHAVVFCSLAPKSNALEVAYNTAAEDAMKMLDEPVPLQIRNAPTKLMTELGYGKDYMYAHDYEGHITAMQCLPDSLKDKHYYNPSDQGLEKRVKEHKDAIEAWKKQQREKEARRK